MPEQRRVKAGSTVVLPCYAVTELMLDDMTSTRRRRTLRATRHSDVTSRRLRHSQRRRAARQRVRYYDWRRGDELIDAALSAKFSVDPLDHSLTIRNASSSSDTAMYSCARRRHGNASTTEDVITSRQIQLVVEGKRLQFTSVHNSSTMR